VSSKPEVGILASEGARVDERLGDPPPRCIQEPLMVRDRDGRPPKEDPLAVHCFCVCSGSALLGDLLRGKQIHGIGM